MEIHNTNEHAEEFSSAVIHLHNIGLGEMELKNQLDEPIFKLFFNQDGTVNTIVHTHLLKAQDFEYIRHLKDVLCHCQLKT